MPHPIQIFTLGQWSDGAAWRWELQHSLESHALIWITRGQGLCIIEGRRRGVGVHNAFALPAKTLFSFDLGKQIFGLITLIPPGSPILMPDEPQHLRIRDAQSQAELTTLLEALQREQNADRDFSDEAMVAHAHLLTVWLRRAMIAQESPLDKPNASEHLLAAFSSLIERDYQSGKPMAEYAAALGVTPTHLTRCCRTSCGLTAAEMLTQRTVYAARDLLERSAEPIQNIAARLGFSSAAYFSRFMVQNTGQTPSSLRKARTRPMAEAPRLLRQA